MLLFTPAQAELASYYQEGPSEAVEVQIADLEAKISQNLPVESWEFSHPFARHFAIEMVLDAFHPRRRHN